MLLDVAVDGGLEVDDGAEDAAFEASAGERGEEAFEVAGPGGRTPDSQKLLRRHGRCVIRFVN